MLPACSPSFLGRVAAGPASCQRARLERSAFVELATRLPFVAAMALVVLGLAATPALAASRIVGG